MKLHEVIDLTNLQRTDENYIKKAVATGIIGAALVHGLNNNDLNIPADYHKLRNRWTSHQQTEQQKEQLAVERILDNYDINEDLARSIVRLAFKYQKPTFPKASDLLAIIGIESAFQPNARSRLRYDPAYGLTQIRPRVWGLNVRRLENINNQVKYASDILHSYYNKLDSADKAVQAYNIGLTKVLQGQQAPRYLEKYYNERSLFLNL